MLGKILKRILEKLIMTHGRYRKDNIDIYRYIFHPVVSKNKSEKLHGFLNYFLSITIDNTDSYR